MIAWFVGQGAFLVVIPRALKQVELFKPGEIWAVDRRSQVTRW